ncbi:MAG: hypothetical protein DWQ19_09300 [Crenarchaeota archaeon]|nr:MAG: hypothetical protein DWQ19_09300 [Thermoproteota archaeon]
MTAEPHIAEATFSAHVVSIKFNNGVWLHVSSNPLNKIYLHFSGIGNEKLDVKQIAANDVEISYEEKG